MSFGFSVADFVTLGQSAWTTYQACKNAGGKYQRLSQELKNLHIALDRLKDEAEKPESLVRLDMERHSTKVQQIWRDCDDILREVDGLIDKHKSLGMSKRRLRDKWQFGTKELGDIRSEIAARTNVINIYIGIVGLSSLGRLEQRSHINRDQLLRIQERIDGLAAEFRAGKREESILTTYSNDHKETSKTFRRSLLSSGFTSDCLIQHGPEIKAYLMQLTKNGMLDEEVYDSDGIQGEAGNEPTTNHFLKPSYVSETPSPPPASARSNQIAGIKIPVLAQSDQPASSLGTDAQHPLGESTTPEIPSSANATRFTLPYHVTDWQREGSWKADKFTSLPLHHAEDKDRGLATVPSTLCFGSDSSLDSTLDSFERLAPEPIPVLTEATSNENFGTPSVGGTTCLSSPRPRPIAKSATEPASHPSEIIPGETPGRSPRIPRTGSLRGSVPLAMKQEITKGKKTARRESTRKEKSLEHVEKHAGGRQRVNPGKERAEGTAQEMAKKRRMRLKRRLRLERRGSEILNDEDLERRASEILDDEDLDRYSWWGETDTHRGADPAYLRLRISFDRRRLRGYKAHYKARYMARKGTHPNGMRGWARGKLERRWSEK
ncbi:hypothetical protein MMC07_002813 [Pseudocyphellaria aurata]|nr:hypothetical protein [Pseudocyphellaria aurata]